MRGNTFCALPDAMENEASRRRKLEQRMLRFVIRLAGMIVLSVAAIMATADVTRSLAVSAPVFTPLGESWAYASPATLASVREHLGFGATEETSLFGLLNLPGSIVVALLAILLLVIGRRKHAQDRRLGA